MSRRVFIGVPLHAPPCDAFRRGYSNLLVQLVKSNGDLNGWRVRWCEQGGGGLPLARNAIAAMAIKEKYDVLLFLAGDIGAKEDNFGAEIARVLSHFDRPEVNIVGGCYLHKRWPLRLVANQDQARKPDAHGLIEVANTGMDFLAVRINVLQKVSAEWPLISARLYGAVIPLAAESFMDNEGRSQGTIWNLFGMAMVYEGKTVKYLPEDFYFCRLAKEAGYAITLDTQIRLSHWGSHNYDAATATGLVDALCAVNPPLPYATP